jgi:transcriptional regulator NrdR family protein
MAIKVVKRDGSTEDFDPDKIIRIAEAAGLDIAKSVQLAHEISQWITSLKKSKVSSLKIRDKVQEVLNTLHPQVADLYRWYQKTKSNS